MSALPRSVLFRWRRHNHQPSEVAQTLPWNMFDFPLQRGEFASASREMAQSPGRDSFSHNVLIEWF